MPRLLLFMFLAALYLSACATPAQPDLGASAATPEPEEAQGDADQLDFCEELFQTLNTLDASQNNVDALALAEKSAKENAESCRAVFRDAAKTPGSRVIADTFADLMLIRAFELSLDRRALQSRNDGVCPDTQSALERLEAVRQRSGSALSDLKLQNHEQGVLQQVFDSMGDKISSLEPFYLRGCKESRFNPALFVSVDDLATADTMTVDQCKDVVVALAAFDLEQAPPEQLTKLIDKLKAATSPCRAALIGTGPVTKPDELEAQSQAELIASGPLMLEISVALANDRHDDACQGMKKYLVLLGGRQDRLSQIIQDTRTPAAIQKRARDDLKTTVDTHKSFAQDYSSLCSL